MLSALSSASSIYARTEILAEALDGVALYSDQLAKIFMMLKAPAEKVPPHTPPAGPVFP